MRPTALLAGPLIASLMAAPAALAQDDVPFEAIVAEAVDAHVVPGFAAFQNAAQSLAVAAAENCAPGDATLRAQYNESFDAWLHVAHLRFGPTETDERGFALAFWPDPWGATPRTLATLIADSDPIAEDANAYAEMSVAARGFHALEFLLYDAQLSMSDDAGYHCMLVRAVVGDIANIAGDLASEWAVFGEQLKTPTPESTFRTPEEAARALFGSLSTGLEFNADARLGRPMGTFDRPRPLRAENRRSERSKRNVSQSLAGLKKLADAFTFQNSAMEALIQGAFDDALAVADGLNDPAFQGVETPIGRIRVESLQTAINEIRREVGLDLAGSLGIAAGFNALDGD